MSRTPSRASARAASLWRSRRARDHSRWFAARMVVSIALTLAVIGVVGYNRMADQLHRQQERSRAAVVRSDVVSFESIGRTDRRALALRRIDGIIDAVGRQPATVAARLVDPGSRIEVPSATGERKGQLVREPRIASALRGRAGSARRYTGGADQDLYELVVPVHLPFGTYAYAVTYDLGLLSSDVDSVKDNLALIGALTLLLGGAIFYLVGGRTLMADHRRALSRATRDGLTELPNHRAFQADLALLVDAAERGGDPLSLLVFDLDGFRALNEREGHGEGDERLRRAAHVLREGRAGDRPFRIGGDEFAVLLSYTDERGAFVRARQLQEALEEAGIAVSTGVAWRRPGESAESLRAEAEAALAESRRRGGARVTDFEQIRSTVTVTTSDKRDALARMLDEGRLSTAYQPIWKLESGTLLALEALSRPDPGIGLSGPAEAFDVAEQTGRVHDLDVLCARRALEAAASLPAGVLLFVNVTPQTLDLDDADESDWLRTAVLEAGLTPGRVAIEVTERFGGRTETVVRTLSRLRAQGFKLALDDVGTGNAGLEMLRAVDADFVKLDRSIVASAPTNPSARAVLMAMATFASHTNSFVIAEGIEDAETLEFLRTLEAAHGQGRRLVQGGQGFGLGRPSSEVRPALPSLLALTPVG